jgi:hypothetical protein
MYKRRIIGYSIAGIAAFTGVWFLVNQRSDFVHANTDAKSSEVSRISSSSKTRDASTLIKVDTPLSSTLIPAPAKQIFIPSAEQISEMPEVREAAVKKVADDYREYLDRYSGSSERKELLFKLLVDRFLFTDVEDLEAYDGLVKSLLGDEEFSKFLGYEEYYPRRNQAREGLNQLTSSAGSISSELQRRVSESLTKIPVRNLIWNDAVKNSARGISPNSDAVRSSFWKEFDTHLVSVRTDLSDSQLVALKKWYGNIVDERMNTLSSIGQLGR